MNIAQITFRDFGLDRQELAAHVTTFPSPIVFAGLQTEWLNVHVDFALLQRIALPIITDSVRYPTLIIRLLLLDVLLHGGNNLGWENPTLGRVVKVLEGQVVFGLGPATRIYLHLAVGSADMRKGFERLGARSTWAYNPIFAGSAGVSSPLNHALSFMSKK
jgi:hypothetical protein